MENAVRTKYFPIYALIHKITFHGCLKLDKAFNLAQDS
jgi:hypothetical protein